MQLQELFERFTAALTSLYDAREAQAVARLYLETRFGAPRHTWALRRLELLPEALVGQSLRELVRLQAGEPVQYVLGRAWFLDLELEVTPAVLIPRQETEELVRWITQEIASPQRIVDAGTGSGCLALALKQYFPQAEVTGLEVSLEALEIARRNARNLGFEVVFQELNLLEAADDAFRDLDVLVSNPPYVPLDEAPSLHPNVREHEPHLALFTPSNDSLIFYRRLLALGRHWLKAGGAVYFETHTDFAGEVAGLAEAFGFEEVSVKPDLSGRPRMVKGLNPR